MTDGDDAPPDGALVVVDAANVVGARPDGWWRDRAGAARRLVEQVAEHLAAAVGTAREVTVVLEGAARAGVPADEAGPLRVVHAADSGDDEIVAVVRRAVEQQPDRAVVVVTADRELRRRVEDLGATTRGPGWLRRLL
jgi:predicted ribonuclease YlaK